MSQTAAGLSDRLNRFAHSPDRSSVQVDLYQALEDAVFLARRFARLKQVELKLESSGNRPQMLLSPFRLQSALFAVGEVRRHLGGEGLILRENVGKIGVDHGSSRPQVAAASDISTLRPRARAKHRRERTRWAAPACFNSIGEGDYSSSTVMAS